MIWLSLTALLAAMLAIAELATGLWTIPAILGLSFIQVWLISWYYMHLRRNTPLVRLAAGASLLWLVVLFALTLSDYLTRS